MHTNTNKWTSVTSANVWLTGIDPRIREIRLRQTSRRINAVLKLITLAGPLAKASASCNDE